MELGLDGDPSDFVRAPQAASPCEFPRSSPPERHLSSMRLSLPLALLLACAQPAWADFISQVVGDNPLGLWILNDSPPTAIDSSGNAFHGTYASGVTPQGIAGPSWVPPAGQVADFIGGTITFPTPLNLGSSGFTIEAWIFPSISSLTQTTRFVASGSGFNGYGFGTAAGAGLLFTSFTQEDDFSTEVILHPNEWQYVGVVVDASHAANFYVNGSLVETVAGTRPTTAPTVNFTIGNQSPGPGHTDEIFNGGLAGISVYDTPLTAAQIQAQYDAAEPAAVPETGTTGLIGAALLGFALLVRHRRKRAMPADWPASTHTT